MSDNSNSPVILAADAGGIAHAARVLRAGGLVAVPTETVYGLAARADSDDAVARIYHAKRRPSFNPLIVHVSGVGQAMGLAHFDERAAQVAETFWPGALTLVLPRRENAKLASAVMAGLETVAVRAPDHAIMQAVIAGTGGPLAAPSANRSGAVSPTQAGHVAQSLGSSVDCILDAGPCKAGLESTILALREDGGWEILRPGPVSSQQISVVIGGDGETAESSAAIKAPGQLASHYAPGKPVRLNVEIAQPNEFHIGFGPVPGDYSLSPAGDLREAAAVLYAALHLASHAETPRIAVAPVPEDGVGVAINDRLRRAAA